MGRMGWPRATRNRWRLIVLSGTCGVQVPAALTLGWLTGSEGLAAGLPAILTLPYLVGLKNPFEERPKSALHLYGGLLPFFAWWAACLAFLLLGPLAWAGAATLDVPLRDALAAGLALSAAVGLYGVVREPRTVRRELVLPGWPAALDGLRVAHLTDIHCGTYTPERRVRRWIERANRLGADVAAVTGDLVTSGPAHVEAVARALGGLRAPLGAYVSLGNHDYFTDTERLVRGLSAHGLVVLRNRGVELGEGERAFYLAGADDTWTRRDDVARALAGRPAGRPAILLAHDPNLFDEAADHGVELTLAGHTHGGQVAVPGAGKKWNLARLVTAYTYGRFRRGASTLYVSRGAGTTGPPVRLGAPGEITLLTLRSPR